MVICFLKLFIVVFPLTEPVMRIAYQIFELVTKMTLLVTLTPFLKCALSLNYILMFVFKQRLDHLLMSENTLLFVYFELEHIGSTVKGWHKV